jgi:hypothetical protein
MLLEELSLPNLSLLSKALKQLSAIGLDGWEKLPAFAHNEVALKEAVDLYNWALRERNGYFLSQFVAFTTIIAARSKLAVTDEMRYLEPTGILDRQPLIRDLATEASVGAPKRFTPALKNALPLLKAIRHLFYTFKLLGDVAPPGNQLHDKHDGLNQKVAASVLKKLGVEGNKYSVTIT